MYYPSEIRTFLMTDAEVKLRIQVHKEHYYKINQSSVAVGLEMPYPKLVFLITLLSVFCVIYIFYHPGVLIAKL